MHNHTQIYTHKFGLLTPASLSRAADLAALLTRSVMKCQREANYTVHTHTQGHSKKTHTIPLTQTRNTHLAALLRP